MDTYSFARARRDHVNKALVALGTAMEELNRLRFIYGVTAAESATAREVMDVLDSSGSQLRELRELRVLAERRMADLEIEAINGWAAGLGG